MVANNQKKGVKQGMTVDVSDRLHQIRAEYEFFKMAISCHITPAVPDS
jgi:hypothetical protein